MRAGGRCQLCNRRSGKLHAHHRTYERLGREAPGDLTVLCDECHDLFHRHRTVESPLEPDRGVEPAVVEEVDLVAFAKELAAGYAEAAKTEIKLEQEPPAPADWDIDGRLRAAAMEHARNYPGFGVDRFLAWAYGKPYHWKKWALSQPVSELNKKMKRSTRSMDWMK